MFLRSKTFKFFKFKCDFIALSLTSCVWLTFYMAFGFIIFSEANITKQ
ncbi:mCG147317 [Mus musculus]|nr:mCG147317 [Mus musculus]